MTLQALNWFAIAEIIKLQQHLLAENGSAADAELLFFIS